MILKNKKYGPIGFCQLLDIELPYRFKQGARVTHGELLSYLLDAILSITNCLEPLVLDECDFDNEFIYDNERLYIPVIAYDDRFDYDWATRTRYYKVPKEFEATVVRNLMHEGMIHFTAWRESSGYIDTDTVFADNLPASTIVLKGEDCYSKAILDTVKNYLNDKYGRREEIKEMIKDYEKRQIDKVIFNPPATIVFWRDGSKTVVKAQDGEPFDKEKGLAMAYVKKCCGNLGNYNDIFKKWCKEDN